MLAYGWMDSFDTTSLNKVECNSVTRQQETQNTCLIRTTMDDNDNITTSQYNLKTNTRHRECETQEQITMITFNVFKRIPKEWATIIW